jgi:glycosyltransferase involved in cell wall biosynthesis
MRIIQIYNRYRSGGGGETLVVNNTIELLRRNGHETRLLERDSAGIVSSRDRFVSAITGVYSFKERSIVSRELEKWRPDLVHVHNLYPLFTPSVLAACNALNIPVVMTVHNYGLTCPIQTHVRRGISCTECVDMGDQRCITNNCRDNIAESLIYAGRHAVAKTLGLFTNNVTLFLPVSEYVRDSLMGLSIPRDRTFVVPNGVSIPATGANPIEGMHAVFLGRFTEEKGVNTLIEAAKTVPEVSVKFYGDGPLRETMRASAPTNVSVHSWLAREDLPTVYRNARCVVVPSTWHEPCPMVAIEAMSWGIPVVATRVGGLSSLVIENETGFLVPPSDAVALGECLRLLQSKPALAGQLGRRARAKAVASYSDSAYYNRLMLAYARAISLRNGVSGRLSQDFSVADMKAGDL